MGDALLPEREKKKKGKRNGGKEGKEARDRKRPGHAL